VLSTGHKSKGREYGIVSIANDFLPIQKEDEDYGTTWNRFVGEQGANLLYVALTRAMSDVNISDEMKSFLDRISMISN